MSIDQLTCPGCSAPLAPPRGRTQFFCQFCGATVVVPSELAQRPPARDEPLHPLPNLERIQLERSEGRLSLRWQWRSWVAFVMIPFALFWNGIILAMTVGILASGFSWILLFLSLFYAIGLFLIYYCLASLINETRIVVEDRTIAVTHGPLPWKAPRPMPVDDIEQLYVKERVHRGKDSTSVQYSLEIMRRSGGTLTLLSGEHDPDIPRTVERLLETHLGIEDRRVKGEHAG